MNGSEGATRGGCIDDNGNESPYLSCMATGSKRAVRAKTTKRTARRKSAVRKRAAVTAKPYDAKKYAGSVPAFASVVAEEMKKWRDDR